MTENSTPTPATPPETATSHLSPVAGQTSLMQWGLGAGALFALVLCFYSIGGHKAEKKEAPLEEAPALSQSAPTPPKSQTLPLNAKQINRLQQNFTQVEDDLAKQRAEETLKLARMREVATTQVYSDSGAAATAASPQSGDVLGGTSGGDDANSRFMARVSATAAPTANATRIQHLSTTLAQGGLIAATLESRIQSDLPGMVRAVTQTDVYSEAGDTLLIPKGSRLVGQYTAGINQGQSRVFVVWQRLLRPDGIDVQLNSPGTDSLGGAGVAADKINNHFVRQFGQAALLSLIGAGVANVGVNAQDTFNSAASYRAALAQSFGQTAQANLMNQGVIKPTLFIHQGAAIQVFVARDLDFYAALQTQ